MPGIFTLFGGYKTPTFPPFPFSPTTTTTTMPLKGKTKTIKNEEEKENVNPNVGATTLPVMPLNATGLPLTCISLPGARSMVYIGPFEWKVLPVDSPPCDRVVEEEEEEIEEGGEKEDMVVGRMGSCV